MTPANAAINRNSAALLRLLAGLFAMLGIAPDGSVSEIPRFLRNAAFSLLRPAESALRRVIIVAASELALPQIVRRVGSAKGKARGGDAAKSAPLFALFDPRAFTLRPKRRRPAMGPGPRITVIGVTEDDRSWAIPKAPPLADDPLSAERLCQRLRAFEHALDTIPQQAQRLMRAKARREHDPPGARFNAPMKPGRAPGNRARGRREVDAILAECHRLAMAVSHGYDTS